MENIIKGRKFYTFFLLVILILGGVLRFIKLDANDLWFDEGISTLVAFDRPAFFPNLITNFSPFFYYLVLDIWTKNFGDTVIVFRSLSAICGTLNIFLMYKVGSINFDKKVGLISSFILALSPFHIWYSQEATRYSFSISIILLTIYFFSLILKENKNVFWVFFTFIIFISWITDYLSFFVILSLALFLLLTKYKFLLRKMFVSFLIVVILYFIFFGKYLIGAIFFLRKTGTWADVPTFYSVIATFDNFNLGYNASYLYYIIIALLFVALFFLHIFKSIKRNKREELLWPLLVLIPIEAIFILSKISASLYVNRVFIIFSPFYYLTIAIVLGSLRASYRGTILVSYAILVTLTLYNYYINYMPLEYIDYVHHVGVLVKKPIKPIVKYIEEHYNKDDIIAHSCDKSIATSRYYLRNTFVKHYNFNFVPYLGDSNSYWKKAKVEYGIIRKLAKDTDSEPIHINLAEKEEEEKAKI